VMKGRGGLRNQIGSRRADRVPAVQEPSGRAVGQR
jgi:hypothetical protein